MDDTTARRRAVEEGVLPIVRIADDPVRWTIDERLAHYGCPGTSVAVMKGGRIDWVEGYGRLDADHDDRCGADTIFMVASCSKPVTALLVLQQVERGVLDLDVPINRFLRRWQLPENDFTRDHPVTLRRILSHTAGLTINGWGVVPQGDPVPTWEDLVLGRPPSKHGPVVVDKAYDGRDRYSGGGFLLAQMAMEDVTGRDYADIADEFLFHPLGMHRTTYRQPLPEAYRTDVAAGHGDDGRPAPGGWMVSAELAAGGLFSTARDYATFLLAARAAWLGEPGAVLGRSLAEEMFTRHDRSGFGLGFRLVSSGDTLRGTHGGSNDGYQSESDVFLSSGDGAVVLTNATSGLFLHREILNGIAQVYDWPDFLLEPKRLATLTPEQMQAYAGEYRIVAGIEMPRLRVWVEDGKLWNEVPGLRFGVQEVYCDVDGVLFNQTGPFETRVEFGSDGRAAAFAVTEAGAPVLRAVREGR